MLPINKQFSIDSFLDWEGHYWVCQIFIIFPHALSAPHLLNFTPSKMYDSFILDSHYFFTNFPRKIWLDYVPNWPWLIFLLSKVCCCFFASYRNCISPNWFRLKSKYKNKKMIFISINFLWKTRKTRLSLWLRKL